MLHAATLVHDDIIDDAKVRRGRPSVNARWGNEITVLMGDWLYMTSFNVVLGERRFPIMDILMDVTRKMVEGELIQLSINGSPEITEAQHLDILMRKTAFLFSACAEIGAILGSATAEHQVALKQYGLNLGIAFQMVDDVLDLTSTESALGKPVGSDLQEGKLTLPLIYLMRDARPEHRDLVRSVLRDKGPENEKKETILRLLREYRSVEQVLEKARQFTDAGLNQLMTFPDSPARRALLAIPDYIMQRER
jgi:octaprenyl-diphosphate synthase